MKKVKLVSYSVTLASSCISIEFPPIRSVYMNRVKKRLSNLLRKGEIHT